MGGGVGVQVRTEPDGTRRAPARPQGLAVPVICFGSFHALPGHGRFGISDATRGRLRFPKTLRHRQVRISPSWQKPGAMPLHQRFPRRGDNSPPRRGAPGLGATRRAPAGGHRAPGQRGWGWGGGVRNPTGRWCSRPPNPLPPRGDASPRRLLRGARRLFQTLLPAELRSSPDPSAAGPPPRSRGFNPQLPPPCPLT